VANSHKQGTNAQPLLAAGKMADIKTTRYGTLARSAHLSYNVFAMETSGALGEGAKELMGNILVNARILPEEALEHSRLSIAYRLLAVKLVRALGAQFAHMAHRHSCKDMSCAAFY
jgi:hypothetical protein